MTPPKKIRCPWAENHPLNIEYHDLKWGRPCHDEGELFKMLILEGQQAGLAWITVLRKKAGYEKAFADFDPSLIAAFDQKKIESLMLNPDIVRHRPKILSIVDNAKAYLNLRSSGRTLAELLWSYVDGNPIVNAFRTLNEIPAKTPLSEKMSRDLKALGFKYVGPVSLYSLAQAVGLVNDHLVDCHFRGV
ncbi:MAG: DNA-3-methyladenine glycosylase I [Deltaproteobacteria bacterium]|nr:DNA-3-methyladenine glycosylase I [Deltaproteobacteria bacterium]